MTISHGLNDLIDPQAIALDLPSRSKKQLFRNLAERVAPLIGRDAELVVSVLGERERLGSTGFGGGIAIPHGKIAGLDRVRGFVARLAEPIDYDAIDRMPVDIIFMLLSPEDAGAEHLKALARVSRALRDRELLDKLRGAGSADAIFALLGSDWTRDAA